MQARQQVARPVRFGMLEKALARAILRLLDESQGYRILGMAHWRCAGASDKNPVIKLAEPG